MPKKILITGGAGFIGSHLAEKLLAAGDEVFVVDDLSSGDLKNIEHLKNNERFHFLYRKKRKKICLFGPLDRFFTIFLNAPSWLFYNGWYGTLKNYDIHFEKEKKTPLAVADDYHDKHLNQKYFIGKIIDEEKIDEIYHLAASVGVKLVLEKPIRTLLNNIISTDIVLNQANGNKNGRKIKVLIASSSEVCGKNNSPSFSEEDDRTYGSVYNIRWNYAFSKGTDEYFGLAYHREHGLPVVIVRLFNVIGPRQTGRYGMVVPTFVQQALENKPITIYGDGKQTRCFADIEDVINALTDLMAEKKTIGEVINLGSEEEVSINQLAEIVKKQTNSASEIVHIPYEQAYREGFEDFEKRVPNLTKIKNLIGYKARFNLEASLKKIIDHFHAR